MFEFIRSSGPWGIVLTLLFLLNIGLVIWSLATLVGRNGKVGPALRSRINSILFWGVFGAAIGLLGQATGIYLALRAVSAAPEISPPVVMEGFAISFLTTIAGLLLLLGSGLAWMVLRSMYGKRVQAMPA
ncbi:MAG: MotA/TolQ/ExbB proton channel family protein [Gemmatimonadota bacterium]|jgi:hypothetical protein